MTVKLTRSQRIALQGFRQRYLDALRTLQEYVQVLSEELGRKVDYDPESDTVNEIAPKEAAIGKAAETDPGIPGSVESLQATGTD